MIAFACTCGEKFEVPAEQAGDQFQCPKCMRLVDVPLLSELGMIDPDGTFKLYDLEDNHGDLSGKMNAFSARDDQRTEVEKFLAIGVKTSDLAPTRIEHGPRYDPETGERVLPVELKENPIIDRPQVVPMATAVLSYSTTPAADDRSIEQTAWWQMPFRLMVGMNGISILFVFLAQVIVHAMLQIPAGNMLLLPFALLAAVMVVAHYCNVVQDFGANQRDRVPVMFRNGSLSEDLFRPLLNVLIAGLISFTPFIAAAIIGGSVTHGGLFVVQAAMLWLGIFLFPAAIFTASCSGAIENMLPTRMLSVIFVAPVRYIWATVAFMAACTVYVLAMERFAFASVGLLQLPGGAGNFGMLAVSTAFLYVLLATATYLMHLAAAWLGSIYGTHYAKLNWVLQRHEPRNRRTDTNAQLAEMRRHGHPRLKPAPAPAAADGSTPPQHVVPINPAN